MFGVDHRCRVDQTKLAPQNKRCPCMTLLFDVLQQLLQPARPAQPAGALATRKIDWAISGGGAPRTGPPAVGAAGRRRS